MHPLYTISVEDITQAFLLKCVHDYSIDCVVDIRCGSCPSFYNGQEFDRKFLEPMVKGWGKYYLSFEEEFWRVYYYHRNKRHQIVYSKALKDENCQRGLQRLRNGIEKYNVLAVEGWGKFNHSLRYSLIGRYFTEQGCKVVHISPNGHYYTQAEAGEQVAQRKKKKEDILELGFKGEDIAAQYLTDNGFQILERNWNLHKGREIDIIAMKNDILHFVEVKTRSSDKYGTPEQAIDRKKIRNILKAAAKYRWSVGMPKMNFMVDTIAIILRSEDDYDLKHHEDIDIRVPYGSRY